MIDTNKARKILGGIAANCPFHSRIKKGAKKYASRVNRRANRKAARLGC